MIDKQFAEYLFGAFSVTRWNDLVRPMEFTEMDHRAFAMMLAFFLGTIEEEHGRKVDWDTVIYGGVFELLRKTALSDIKATVHRRIRSRHPEEYERLNEWVAGKLEPLLSPYGLVEQMREYFLLPDVAGGQAADSGAGAGGPATPSAIAAPGVATASEESAEDPVARAYRILEAAKVYSSYREFQIARPVNAHDPRLPEIETDLRERLEPFLDFVGMRRLIMELDLYRLIGVVDRLRYQARWSRTPRIPQTSVLGHSLMVAVFSLLFSVQIGACPVRRYNNFFGALFHDLPEAVTRDIVAPTKSATPGLPDIVKQIEEDTVAEELYPFMSPGLREKIRYFTENEFESRVLLGGAETILDPDEITARYNSDEFRPVDGKLIRVADEFAAFLEAHQSMLYGVSSPALIEGRARIYGAYIKRGTIAGVDVGAMYHQFELRS